MAARLPAILPQPAKRATAEAPGPRAAVVQTDHGSHLATSAIFSSISRSQLWMS